MKILTPSTITLANQRFCTESIVLIKLELDSVLYYGDERKTVNTINYNGKILELGELRSEKTADNTGNVQSISVTLEDGDLFLKSLITSKQIIGKKATVYHMFETQGEPDFIEVLVGFISTPLKWNEGQRTFSFDIVGRIDSKELGCFISRDIELNIPGQQIVEDAYDKRIPIVFGTVENVAAFKLIEPIKGKLGTAFGTYPLTAGFPLLQNFVTIVNGEAFPQNVLIVLIIGGVPVSGIMNGTKFTINTIAPVEGTVKVNQYGGDDLNPYEDLLNYYDSKNNIIHINEDINILGKCLFCMQIDRVVSFAPGGGDVIFVNPDLAYIHSYRVIYQDGKKIFLNKRIIFAAELVTNTITLKPPENDTLQIRNCAAEGLWTMEPGADVFMNTDQIYPFNCGPTAEVLDVKAYRTDIKDHDGTKEKVLASLPPGTYSINLAYTLGGHTFSVIIISSPFGTMWDMSTIYVSLRSSLSPNTSDVLSYLLREFTNADIDTPSFANVATLIDKYPSNFALTKEGDAFGICNEIAWQARCALYTSGIKVKLLYLSKEPVNVGELNDGEIEEASPEIFLTETDQIITDLVAKYKLIATDEKESTQHFRQNVDLFGLKKQEKEFYIYNNDLLVIKSLVFWGNRYSNQWIKVTLKAFLTEIGVEIFDALQVVMDILTSKMLIDNITHNTQDNSLTFEFWTPIIAGTNVQSGMAWMDDSGDIKPADVVIIKNYVPYAPAQIEKTDKNRDQEFEDDLFVGTVIEDGGDSAQVQLYENGLAQPPTKTVHATKGNDTTLNVGDKVIVTKEKDLFFVQPSGGSGNATVRVSTLDAIVLFGLQTIDDISLAVDDLVLVRNQVTDSQNGLYKVKTGAWERTGTLKSGMLVSVREGTFQSGVIYVLTSADGFVIT